MEYRIAGVAASRRIDVRQAVGMRVDQLSAFDHRDARRGDSTQFQHLCGNLVDALTQGWVDRINRLCSIVRGSVPVSDSHNE
jgi:hypothetical protein